MPVTTVAIILEDNTVSIEDVNLDLKFMQTTVGGYIEFVYLASDPLTVMVVNEEGKILDLPINAIATALFQSRVQTFDIIKGPALVIQPKGEDSYVNLTPIAFEWITQAVDVAVAANS